jgi:FMN phosphatase YigB (HAD superfamily)
MKKYILFDFDGTILDSQKTYFEHQWWPALIQLNSELDMQHARSIHRDALGFTVEQIQEEYIRIYSLSRDDFLASFHMHGRNIDLSLFSFFEDTLKLLDKLYSSDKYLAILSNGHKEHIENILRGKNLRHYFHEVISCADEGFSKPDPKCLNELIDSKGWDRDMVMYLGDTDVDLQFAESAGIDYLIFDHHLHKGKFFENIIKLFE